MRFAEINPTDLRRKLFSLVRFIFQPLVDFIYPPYCLLCNGELQPEEVLVCRTCLETLPNLEQPMVPAEKVSHQLSEPAWFAASLALFPFTESVQEVIHYLKYKGGRSLAVPLGGQLGLLLQDLNLAGEAVLTPVPLHKRRLRERGYNQSELLAKEAALQSGLAFDATLLQRIRYTRTQAKLSKTARSRNVAGAFRVVRPEAVQGRTVVLVDDLFTTGHTLNECAKTLRCCGCERVYCLTLVRV